ncbi:MAG: Glutamyl-tRNA(Gln) amidotransferase subunit C [candidate division WS2 bacterium]|uniref:Glutamyl-tRNA(Gln) amidotransferase subunit C n=1 Tax=Psychracetigena formicireducens TaxID=2986056 RepID=A0A9E2BFZ5_PSYF1|nr:Glutamyl-tRNA(Gln) amidotransferase subunit C [Candidatus Psychracetigena formicireducens]MBT9144878.1 Glutamyl-tRNA(Gln) amidotransferase subunit C [Candidatus Psychracetigena formicireducens]MBT9150397.1 Glutamyl-tRNA(Gln) amidotransferase subunit C [Candidatus Psychracetigena formicireducens]
MKNLNNLLSLASLKVSEEEEEKLAQEVFKIIKYFDELKEVEDSSLINPSSLNFHPQELILREDRELPFTDREEIMRNFPELEGEYLKSPPIEKE